MLSVAALVSAHASKGPMFFKLSRVLLQMAAMISRSARSVRVLPVPGGPCTITSTLYA